MRRKAKTRVRIAKLPADGAPVRVLAISVTGVMGGAERSFLEVLRALPRERIAPVACVPPDSPLDRLCAAAEIPVESVNLRRFRRSTNPFVLAGQVKALYQGSRAIVDICKEQKIDLIHANTDSAAFVAWEVSRITQLPFVWHCRDLVPMHGFARILSSAAAGVVAISRAVEAHLLNEGVAREKLHVIENGIDLTRIPEQSKCAEIRANLRAELRLDANRPTVLCVGSYAPWKRLEQFLDMLAQLRTQVPEVMGLLVGSEGVSNNHEYGEALMDHATAVGLDPTGLRFLGERDDVPALMAASDLLVSCSENEPFGRVLAEAGAAGLPVVSTRSGGKAEIVDDGTTGFLTAQGDVPELTAACARLLKDAALREKFGAAARERVEKLFDVHRTAGEVAQLFETITGRREASHV